MIDPLPPQFTGTTVPATAQLTQRVPAGKTRALSCTSISGSDCICIFFFLSLSTPPPPPPISRDAQVLLPSGLKHIFAGVLRGLLLPSCQCKPSIVPKRPISAKHRLLRLLKLPRRPVPKLYHSDKLPQLPCGKTALSSRAPFHFLSAVSWPPRHFYFQPSRTRFSHFRLSFSF
jgi:hypothetical protein